MANITLWQLLKEDSFFGLYLPNTENWSEKLSIEQIVEILLFHNETATEKDKKFLQDQMNLFAKNGGIEFDEVELYFSFHNYIKRITSNSYSDLDDINDSLLKIHSPNSVINALSHIKEGEYIELKEYCGSKCKTCKCTLIKSYYNRLPESWQIEGVHILYGFEESIKLSGCSIPMMTAKQCYNFLHSKQYYDIVKAFKLKGVTINLDNSFLKGWWEGDIAPLSTAYNQDSNKTDDETESIYCKYKASIDDLVATRGIDLKALKVEDIFEQLKLFDKILWSMKFASFQRNVWRRYSSENGIKKNGGRPRNAMTSKKQ